MKQRKKIDELYRERLYKVETPPPADSWEFISSQLPPEKKDRALPFWYKLAGAAAALVLLVTLFNLNTFNGTTPEESPVTNRPEEQIPGPSNAATVYQEAEERSAASESSSKEIREAAPATERIASGRATVEVTTEPGISAKPNPETSTVIAFQQQEQKAATGEMEQPKAALAETIEKQKEPSAVNAIAEGPTHDTEDPSKQSNSSLKKLFEEEATEATAEREGFLKRLRISTTAAAVFFDHLGGGNTLDDQLANAGGGEASMSYGVNLAYQVSEKIKIRSGVNKVNLNYNVPNVDYATVMQTEAINQDPAASAVLLSFSGASVTQDLGFIEVPLEMEYAIIDRKIGVNLIGGASTLFLENNNLSLNASGFTTELGEAQNLNNLSFSANLGLGLHYNLSQQFRLNLEPIFKYQINTFNNSPGLKPYYFGIYSGLSFQF